MINTKNKPGFNSLVISMLDFWANIGLGKAGDGAFMEESRGPLESQGGASLDELKGSWGLKGLPGTGGSNIGLDGATGWPNGDLRE